MVVGSHPLRRSYTGREDRMVHVTLCCPQKSHIPVVTEMQFMKCHMSMESNLGNEKAWEKRIISVSTRVPCVSYLKLSTFACLCFPLFSYKEHIKALTMSKWNLITGSLLQSEHLANKLMNFSRILWGRETLLILPFADILLLFWHVFHTRRMAICSQSMHSYFGWEKMGWESRNNRRALNRSPYEEMWSFLYNVGHLHGLAGQQPAYHWSFANQGNLPSAVTEAQEPLQFNPMLAISLWT